MEYIDFWNFRKLIQSSGYWSAAHDWLSDVACPRPIIRGHGHQRDKFWPNKDNISGIQNIVVVSERKGLRRGIRILWLLKT